MPALVRRAAVVVGALVAALTLAGCESTVTLEVNVETDGTARVEVRLDVDEDAAAVLDEAVVDARRVATDVDVVDPLDAFAATVGDLEGWTLTDTVHDHGGRRLAAATRVGGPDEFEDVVGDLVEALDGPEGRLFGPLRMTLDDDHVRVDGELAALVDPAAALGLTHTPERARVSFGPHGETVDLDELVADPPLDVRLDLVLPGALVDANADAAHEQRLTWHGEIGEARAVRAVAERRPPRWWPWITAAVGVAALVAASVVVVLVRRRV